MRKILKFGGSSVGSIDRIKRVIDIVKAAQLECSFVAIVVSAFGGVTDHLVSASKQAASGKEEYKNSLLELVERHLTAAHALIAPAYLTEALKVLETKFHELSNVLEGIYLIHELSPKTMDLIMSFGERLCAFIIYNAALPDIPQAQYLDARDLIKTDRSFNAGQVDFEKTNHNIRQYFEASNSLNIITGFIASSKENETTTLGRGGSDYTAAIFGAALGVNVIEIWTDVDGVMTADPRKEPFAFTIPEMSYKEAMEMSYFGAKVIHPPTIVPALEKNIPLLIKNSLTPTSSGTFISSTASKNNAAICGISSIDNVVLLSVQGGGMVGVCGIAKRLFGALAEKNINIILISQGSSEHSICFAVSAAYGDSAKEAIEKEFSLEMRAHMIEDVIMEKNLSVIAIVGENMRMSTGTAGKLFSALGKNGINIIAIAQGSSELNITVVVKKEDEVKAIRAIHEGFFLSKKATVNVFLIGTGLIGKALLENIHNHSRIDYEERNLDIHLIGIANSSHMVFNTQGIPLDNWNDLLDHSTEKMHIKHFIEKMQHQNTVNAVFVDCTSSQDITDHYEDILDTNISIVTPNKKANSGSYENYKKLNKLSSKKGVDFSYGSNVGAGLPIISTIDELVRSGDKVTKIEAILSGTLSFLFNTFTTETHFSETLKNAQEQGFTEPDPRDDLNGMDVARKLLILARECGYPLEISDILIEKIVPEEYLQAPSVAEFYSKLKSYDHKMSEKLLQAKQAGKVLRYVAKFENGKGKVSLEELGVDHPFYHLSKNDNIIAITSNFYKDTPLVIKGQGAGATVTAGKIFGDIVRIGLEQI
ncbi:MAG: bifunctional aspartate kinase/homoserine dehydrogenase I [Parachlamydiales bacterium]|jgi:aspartokinase/homoserine dehydrogenase 1